jgi:hypothetical protein
MNAAQRIANIEANDVYYRKVGRKYIKMNDPCAYASLTKGYHLIKVDDGCTSIKAAVYPERAERDAALDELGEELIKLISEATRAQPDRESFGTKRSAPISREAADDWNTMVAKHGDTFKYLSYGSCKDIAERVLAGVRARMKTKR